MSEVPKLGNRDWQQVLPCTLPLRLTMPPEQELCDLRCLRAPNR